MVNEGGNILIDLARALSAGGDHSTAIVLRRLARAGYTSLEQIDRTPDWILLSLPGIGAKRLSAVRLLTRAEWQAPSRQAIQVVVWFLTAAQYTLRFWPWENLVSFILGPVRPGIEAMPSDKRLALDVFSQAAHNALNYCPSQELANLVSLLACGPTDCQAGESWQEQGKETTVGSSRSADRPGPGRESDHFAYARERRREIVQHYWAARDKGQIASKDSWAAQHYRITGRTLLRYEHEVEQEEKRA